MKVKQIKENETEDYRPPIPPHRNIGVSTQNVLLEDSPRRHHHHRHYHSGRENKKRDSKPDYYKQEPEIVDTQPCNKRSVFEFDDEPSTPTNVNGVKMRQKSIKDVEDNVQFVEFPKSQNCEGGNG